MADNKTKSLENKNDDNKQNGDAEQTTQFQAGNNDEVKETNPTKKGKSSKLDSLSTKKILAILAAVIVVIALVGGAFALGNYLRGIEEQADPSNQTIVIDNTGQNEGENGSEEAANDDGECNHQWETNWDIKKIPAKTHVEHHDAVYEDQTTYHTACNVCGSRVDGADGVREHRAETGHDSGYTPNVPFTDSVEVEPAWDETVVDTPESEELVPNGEICSLCGEKKDVEDLDADSNE